MDNKPRLRWFTHIGAISLFVFLIGCAATSPKVPSDESSSVVNASPPNQEQKGLQADSTTNRESDRSELTPSPKWFYVETPLDFGVENDRYGGARLIILYENGEFIRFVASLEKSWDDNKTITLTAYFDEIVQYGTWKGGGSNLKLTIAKCRCEHCFEERPNEELRGNKSRNPLPINELWTTKKGRIGQTDSVLTRNGRKYRFLPAIEFLFENYGAMVAEVNKIRSYQEDRASCNSAEIRWFEKG